MKKHLRIDFFIIFVLSNDVCASLENLSRAFSLKGITIGKPKDKRTLVGGLSNLCKNEYNMNNIFNGNKSNLLLTTILCVQHWNEQIMKRLFFEGTFSFSFLLSFLDLFFLFGFSFKMFNN